VFAHLQRLGLDFYENEMAGRILTRMTSDVDTLSDLLQNGLINAVVNAVTFIGMLVVLFVLSPWLALATLALIPPLAVATAWFRRRSSAAYDRQRERIAAVNADLQENLSGVRETQAFRRQSHNVARFRDLGAAHRDAGIEAMWIQARYFGFAELLAGLGTALVLGLGALLVHRGSITVGVLVAFLLYLTQFFAPIQQLSQVFDSWQKAAAGMRKLDDLLTTPTSVPTSQQPTRLPRLRGEVCFDQVRFRYAPAAPWALDGIDVVLHAGQSVALVGETGSGKSTLVKLVARFHDPTEGAVLVDGIDLRTVDPSAYRQQLGYVPQEPFLFAGTVAANLAYGRPGASRAELEAAARAVGLHERIMRLPGGYDHELIERGRSLSTGERQLLCLARALVVDPAVLILDEATSNLDLASEARINEAMDTVCGKRTSVTIAHRLPTARRAQRILVLDGGRIVEDGDHDSLLARGGRYADMWQAFADPDQPDVPDAPSISAAS
jgi:ATP-binding cassette subfamily B protein